MTTATLEKRVRSLEAEVKILKAAVVHQPKKKLPRWLQASLDDANAGKISGPFKTTKELMAHLRK
jgi:hypothetical protein